MEPKTMTTARKAARACISIGMIAQKKKSIAGTRQATLAKHLA